MTIDWLAHLSHDDRVQIAYEFVASSLVPEGEEHAARALIQRAIKNPALLRLPTLPRLGSHDDPVLSWKRDLGPGFREAWMGRWKGDFASSERGATVVVPESGVSLMTPPWLDSITHLLVPEIANAMLIHRPSRAKVTWSWPLRIGARVAEGGLGELRRLLTHPWNGVLFKLVRPDRSAGRLDLLLVEGSGAEGAAAVEKLRSSASAVVLVGERSDTTHHELAVLDLAARYADAVLVARQPPPTDLARWLQLLVTFLSHAQSLEKAIFHAAHETGAGLPLVVGDWKRLGDLELRTAARKGIASWRRFAPSAASRKSHVAVPPALRRWLNLPELASPNTLAGEVERRFEELVFDREREGATTLGHAIGLLGSWARRKDRSAESGQRSLRARLMDQHRRVERGPLCSGRQYRIEASVGPCDPEWHNLRDEFPAPHSAPDDPERGWLLRVWAWEPSYLPRPVMKDVWLPIKGATEPVAFDLEVVNGVPGFGARITVVHGNRVLQTGLLALDDKGELSWDLDGAPVPHLEGLNRDKWVDLSVVLNHDLHGVPRAFVQQDDTIGDVDLPQNAFDAFTRAVSAALQEIADAPEKFTTFRSEAMTGLLRRLAQPGAQLYRSIVRGTAVNAADLKASTRVQIVQAKALTFFPAELLYSYPAPSDTAVLCPGAEQALHPSSARCPEKTHDSSVVCPSGFWSLDKIIERHAHQQRNGLTAPYRLKRCVLPPGALFDPLLDILFAASSAADASDTSATSRIETTARAVAGRCDRVDSWDEWMAQIRTSKRSLLLLVPHHDPQDRLFIGDGSGLLPSQIDSNAVDPTGSAHPVVLLLGCKTLLTQRLFDDLVQAFQWEGAGVVVSTYATVLGRHVAPATEALLRELDHRLRASPIRMGDVLLAIRRQLLLQGMPMALGLTAYGDADVLLGREP